MPQTNAANGQKLYLKGSGNNFNEKWNNVFYLGGAQDAEDPNVWHLVYSGNDMDAITEMQLTFTNGEVFNWDPSMGFSTNGGGNNPGWVIVAPYDWKIAYVNSGNNNISDSYVVTNETGNLNFNISGYHKGSPDTTTCTLDIPIDATLTTTTETILQKWQRTITPYEEWTQYVSDNYGSVTATTDSQLALLKYNAKNGNIEDKDKDFNKVVVPNSNHFTYAKLSLADLKAGVKLTLVVGNKIDKVGTATAKIVDGKLVLTFGDLYKATFGAVAFTKLLEPKNGNIHSDKVFSHNNKAIIDLPAADKDGFIYLYIHFDTLQYDLGKRLTKEWTIEGEFTLKCEKVIKTETVTEKVPIEVTVSNRLRDVITRTIDSSLQLTDLEPEEYTITYLDTYNDATKTETVTIPAGGSGIAYGYFAQYFANAEPIIKTIYLRDIMNPVVISNKLVVVK